MCAARWLVVLVASTYICRGQLPFITIAGNGSEGFTGDSGPAIKAELNIVTSIAVDAAGNIYFADSGNKRLRKVDTAGIITTIAGTGVGDFTGDGGPAINAAMSPQGVAVDGVGNIYVADTGSSRIRKIDTSGIITTIAGSTAGGGFAGDGGPAINAKFSVVQSVAVDKSGNVYLADRDNNRVRKINNQGIINTIAGNGTTIFSGDGGPATSAGVTAPNQVALDAAGNLFISSQGGRIRKVDTSGIITTVAGSGVANYFQNGDGGPALKAAINSPNGIAVDHAGNLYITDEDTGEIRKVDPNGIITAFTTNLSLLTQQLAVDGAGNLFIADNLWVREVKVPAAAPVISANGIVNGANFQPGIVPGSWATMEGSNLASVTDNWNKSIVNGKLPTSLDGVTVMVGNQAAYLYYIGPGQINFLVPNVAPGPIQVSVTNAGGTSSAIQTTANQYGPAFFTWPNSQAVATRQDFSLAAKTGTFPGATTVAAKPGDVLILWGTGLGPTNPAPPAGVQVPTDQTYSTAVLPLVTIGTVPALVYGAALAPGYSGLYQIAIQVPASLGDGDWPISISVANVASTSGVILSVLH